MQPSARRRTAQRTVFPNEAARLSRGAVRRAPPHDIDPASLPRGSTPAVRSPFPLRSILALAVTALALGVAACGADEEEPAGTSAGTETSEKRAIRVGLVTDIG